MMKHDDLLKLARDRLEAASTADHDNREKAKGDLEFLIGEQWDERERLNREAEGRPCLTINRMPQFVRQVTGQIRQTNPAVRVRPADGFASDEVSEIYEGLIREIEARCDASAIYEGAAESAAACGIGNFRIRADFAPGDTFEQELIIERIPNPFAVFWDDAAREPTRKDAQFCFIAEDMPRKKFEADYPGKSAADLTNDHTANFITNWCSGDTVTVAEYYWIEHREVELGLGPDGSVIRGPFPDGMTPVRTRKLRQPVVMWAKISGVDVLEGPQEVPSPYIPVVAVVGDELVLGDTLHRSSVIRYAKDPQRLYNYTRSTGAEVMALQPKAPYMVTAEQVKGYEEFWADANSANRPYLPYNADGKAPPPQRIPPPVPSAAVQTETQLAAEDMKGTTGIYDASLGAGGNETSGVAIRQRQQEAQLGNSIYADNMSKAVRHAGDIMVSMLPKIYDTRRVVRLLGEDGAEKEAVINELVMSEQGPQPVNDLTIGRYSVRITVGPTYATKRQEASEGMVEFIRVVPQAAALTADLIAKAQDWPDADTFSDRLKSMLPPGTIKPEDMPDEERAQAEQAQQQQQQQQAQMQQMQQQAAELAARKATAEVTEAEAGAKLKQAEAEMKVLEAAQATGQIAQVIQQQVQQAIMQLSAPQEFAPPPMAAPYPGPVGP